MYENKRNSDLKARIIQMIENSNDYHEEILRILISELKEVKLSINTNISFCSCGYPISYNSGENRQWLEAILKQEVDFRSYREYYYCPKCNRLLDEFQH